MRIKNSPYNLKETLGYFKRNYLGPVARNRGLVEYCPQNLELNPMVQPNCKIAFIGDIMDMWGRHLRIGDRLKRFVADCDYLVGNFEATITTEKGAYMAQRHIPQILEALADLFSPEKTFLGMANNHSGDFGFEIWSRSRQRVRDGGFHVFGSKEVPYVDIGHEIRIVGATQWSNQPVDYISRLKDAEERHKPGSFNILYPHWGYEMELFPRPEVFEQSIRLSQRYDAIIGHHSHIPQPIAELTVERTEGPSNQLVAYGLGDFCIFEKLRHYLYGQVMSLTFGPNGEGGWKAGRLEWRFTSCRSISDKLWQTDIETDFPYPKR
jgi:hypothetical protein